jgi:acetyl-CoA acetyltransferase
VIDPRTPILVGCGQITDTTGKPSSERSNVAFCAEAAGLALADTGASNGAATLGRKIDAVAVLEFFPDISPRFASPFGRCSNPPKAVAKRLAAAPRQLLYTHSGGNMPQYLVNRFAEEIANGETELALVCGAELLRSTQNARKAGLAIDHTEDPGGEPTRIGDNRFGFSDEEARHELRAAIHFYPLLENAIRGGLKRDVASHMTAMGRLFERLAAVAKANPLATRREGYSAERLATISDDNRWICFPYPRLMNSNAIIDQAAAVLMTSVEKARDWGIPQDRWVFLHGCADGTDTWVVSERERLDASPAIRGCARIALDMAGKSVADVAAFDLYSCFPLGGRGGDEGDRDCRRRPTPDQRHRRAPVLRRTGQQLRDALHRRDDECGAQEARLVRHGDGQRQLPHQALCGPLLDRADQGAVAARGSQKVPGRAGRAPEATRGHAAGRHGNDRDLLRGLRQGCAGKGLHPRPPRRLGRSLRRHGRQRSGLAGRHADERAAWA